MSISLEAIEKLSAKTGASPELCREALERAMGLTPMEAPVRAVLDNATVHWAE